MRNAKKESDIADLHVKWKEKELDVRIAAVEKEKAAIAVAEAERDLAGVSKLHEQNVPSAAKYRVEGFKTRLGKRQKEYEAAVNRLQKETGERRGLKKEYETRSKQYGEKPDS